MTPELRFAITAQNKSSAVLQQVKRDVVSLGAAAPATGRSLVKAGEDVERGAMRSRMAMLELGHSARSTFDILASGGSPFRALALEGPRLAQALGLGPGGVLGTLKAFAPVLIPTTVALGAAAVGFAGMQHELDKATGKNITFMETVKATGQAIWSGLVGVAGPAVKKVGDWFGQLVDFLAPHIKAATNFLVGNFKLAFDDTVTTWKMLPNVMGDVTLQAVNAVIGGTQQMINGAIDQINSLVTGANAQLGRFGLNLNTLGHVKFGGVDNPYAGATSDLQKQLAQNAVGDLTYDYGGAATGNIQKFALQDYAADNAGKADKLAKAFKGLTAAEKAARQEFQFYQSTFSSFFTSVADDLRQGQSFWQALGNAASDALGSISDHLIQLGANDIFNQLFGNGSGTGFGGILGSLFGLGGSSLPGNFSIAGLPMYASGTSSASGGLSLVGENGPELVNLSRGASVTPAMQTQALLGRRGGDTIHFHNTGSAADAAAIAKANLDAYRKYQLAADMHQFSRFGRIT